MSERVRRYLAGERGERYVPCECEARAIADPEWEGIACTCSGPKDGWRVVYGVAQGPEGSPAEDVVTLQDISGEVFALAGAEQLRRALRPTRESEPVPVRVGSEREGWRARLANVERLLSAVEMEMPADGPTRGDGTRLLGEALAEVRSMIDGDETTGAA